MSDGTAQPVSDAPTAPSGDAPAARRRRRNPEQTRRVIIDALLAAIKDGKFLPTAKDIAERAGVSERSIFVHFPGRDDLRIAAVEAQSEYVETLIAAPDPQLPWTHASTPSSRRARRSLRHNAIHDCSAYWNPNRFRCSTSACEQPTDAPATAWPAPSPPS